MVIARLKPVLLVKCLDTPPNLDADGLATVDVMGMSVLNPLPLLPVGSSIAISLLVGRLESVVALSPEVDPGALSDLLLCSSIAVKCLAGHASIALVVSVVHVRCHVWFLIVQLIGLVD